MGDFVFYKTVIIRLFWDKKRRLPVRAAFFCVYVQGGLLRHFCVLLVELYDGFDTEEVVLHSVVLVG